MTYDHLIGMGFHRWETGFYTPGQIQFMDDTNSASILYTGAYRAGKTEIASRAAIRHCLTFPTAKFGVFRAKLKSLRQSTLRTVLELVHPSWVASWSNSELELRFFNGATLNFLGCDFADRIGSIELSGAFIDEAHETTTEAYGMIVGRMSAPLTVDYDYLNSSFPHFIEYAERAVNNRQVYLACNPKGRNHWLYSDFLEEDTRLPGRQFYSSNTITNKNLPESYLRQNLAQYARVGVTEDELIRAIQDIRNDKAPSDGMHLVPKLTPFGQRNLLGLWVALEGAIFEMDAKTQQVEGVPEGWGEASKWYAAVDFGYHHPRAILASYHGGKLLVQSYWADEKVDQTPLLDILADWDKQVNLAGVIMPPDQPGIISQARKRLGASKILKANNKVLSGIGSTQVAINRAFVRFSKQPIGVAFPATHFDLFWGEMEGYTWKQDKDGNWLDEPNKEDDHFPDSLRYLIHTLVTLKKLDLQPKEKPQPLKWKGLGKGLQNGY